MATSSVKRIVRAAHDTQNPYFMMLRATAQNKSLSYEARGLIAYLLSKPDDWEIMIEDLCQECGRGRVYRIIKDLLDAKYLDRIYHRDDKGKITAVEYVVHEQPFLENPEMDNPKVENRTLHNIDKKQQKDKKQKKDGVALNSAAIIDTWLKCQHAIKPNAFKVKKNHELATGLIERGISCDDVIGYVRWRRSDDFWNKFLPLEHIAENILVWKRKQTPPAPVMEPEPEEDGTYIDIPEGFFERILK